MSGRNKNNVSERDRINTATSYSLDKPPALQSESKAFQNMTKFVMQNHGSEGEGKILNTDPAHELKCEKAFNLFNASVCGPKLRYFRFQRITVYRYSFPYWVWQFCHKKGTVPVRYLMDLDPGSQKVSDPVPLSRAEMFCRVICKISQKAGSTGELSMCSMPEI